jgi:hypothetical protein
VLCSYSRAYTEATTANLGAASASAMGIGDASTSCKLLAFAITDILSTSIV